MLDIRMIRENPDEVIAKLKKRIPDGYADIVKGITGIDIRRRELLGRVDEMKARRNAAGKKIPGMKKAGEDTGALMTEMKQLGDEIDAESAELGALERRQEEMMLQLPNLPDDDVPAGGKEQNVELRVFGKKPAFDFEIKDHVELAESLELVDYKRGAKLGGSGSWVYRGMGSRLEWALLNFFIGEHLNDGYEFVLPPHMLNWECGYVAGQFPKFSDDVYHIANPSGDEKKFMLPTAETALVNLHRGEILAPGDLPRKYIAYTPCYRREAGSYRSEERGMIRGHQFNKVEMVQYTTAEDSDAAFGEMVGKAERLLQKLGLHHRVSKLAAADVSAGMARTFDIEIFIPSMGIYKEVSSASNAREYQARRGNIRYRGADGRLCFCHTLNASGLATSRVFPALLEQYQQPDGSVRIPDALVPFFGGVTEIRKTGSRGKTDRFSV